MNNTLRMRKEKNMANRIKMLCMLSLVLSNLGCASQSIQPRGKPLPAPTKFHKPVITPVVDQSSDQHTIKSLILVVDDLDDQVGQII